MRRAGCYHRAEAAHVRLNRPTRAYMALIRLPLPPGRGPDAGGGHRRLSSDASRWSPHRVDCCAMDSKSDCRLRLGASGRAVHFRRV
jgi:hypothetical protein